MVPHPHLKDFRIIAYYLSKIIFGLGIFMAIPLALGLFFQEPLAALDFALAILITFSLGFVLRLLFYTKEDLDWKQAMIVASLSWLVAMFLGALPLYLSGHFKSFLDACFEAMSGFATTGLTLAQDLDHLSRAHNLWRHLTMFIGGQGIVVVALTFLMSGVSGAFKMYVGEAREERVLPNVVETARFIWLVSLVYLVLGSGVLTAIAIFEGMKPLSAAFHSVCVFMAAWDTGGFTPQSQNILYYHSLPFEVATMSLMLLGGLNFKLHYAVWHGQRKEIFKNIEPITLFITIMATMALVCFGLGKTGMYSQPLLMFRKGFYHIISAHTGTGYGTLYAEQFRKEWGDLALTGIILAMGFGAGACSTSGGIKNLRLGLIFKALRQDIKKIILPESAVVVEKFQHIRKIILEDKTVRAAALILLCYVVLYLLGTIVGLFCGYPLNLALFESTSAAANVGLSCGITQAAMPAVLKVTYIIQMWAGRLEFMSVFAFIGLIYAAFKGK